MLFKSSVATLILLSLSISSAQEELPSSPVPFEMDYSQYAPKPLSSQISERARRMLSINSIHNLLLSPDGQQVYFNSNASGVDQIWNLQAAKSQPLQLTTGEEKTTLQAISPDGKFLYYTRDVNGEDFDGLFRLDIKTLEVKTLFHKPNTKAKFGGLSRDGERVYFLANDKTPEYFTIYRYFNKTAKTELVHFSKSHWKFFGEISPEQVYLYRTKGIRDRTLYTYNIAKQKLNLFLGKKNLPELGYFEPIPLKEGKVIVRSHHDSEFYRLYLWDGKVMVPLSPLHNGDVVSYHYDSSQDILYFELDQSGKTQLHGLDLKTRQSVKIPELKRFGKYKPTQFTVQSTSQDGNIVAIRVQGPQLPDKIYLWNRRDDNLQAWTKTKSSLVSLKELNEPILDHFLAEDGTQVPMLVRRPQECRSKVCPVVVHFHGGPESQSRPILNPLAEIFVQSGIIFVEPNVRGSRGYGRKFLEADDGRKRVEVIRDIRDVAQHIKKNWAIGDQVPPVGITGRSYGGYLTLYGMTRFAEEFDAGVAVVGMSSLVTLLENTAPYRRERRETEYGSLETDKDLLESLSPINYIKNVSAPLLIIHGVNDKKVPVSEALQAHQMLKNHNPQPELILFEDEGHKVTRRDNRVLEYGHILRFFKEHLKVAPTGKTLKAGRQLTQE